MSEFRKELELLNEHPIFQEIQEQIEALTERVSKLEASLNNIIEAYHLY